MKHKRGELGFEVTIICFWSVQMMQLKHRRQCPTLDCESQGVCVMTLMLKLNIQIVSWLRSTSHVHKNLLNFKYRLIFSILSHYFIHYFVYKSPHSLPFSCFSSCLHWYFRSNACTISPSSHTSSPLQPTTISRQKQTPSPRPQPPWGHGPSTAINAHAVRAIHSVSPRPPGSQCTISTGVSMTPATWCRVGVALDVHGGDKYALGKLVLSLIRATVSLDIWMVFGYLQCKQSNHLTQM